MKLKNFLERIRKYGCWRLPRPIFWGSQYESSYFSYIFGRSLIAALIFTAPGYAAAEELEVGSLTASSGSEAGAVPDKIRDQIVQFTKAIQHGAPQFLMVGRADADGADFIINGDKFSINKDTVIVGDFKPGSYVEVRGELVQGKPMVATQVVVAAEGGAKRAGAAAAQSSSDSPFKRAQESR